MRNRTALSSILMIVLLALGIQAIEEKGRLKNGTIALNNGLISAALKDEQISSVIDLIVDIYELKDGCIVKPPINDKPIKHWVFHPDVNNTVSLKLSGVTKVDAIEQVFHRSTVGRIYTGLKTKEYPKGNVVVVVPYEKMSDFEFQNRFITISNKAYIDKLVSLSLHRADIRDIVTLLFEVMGKHMDLHESCQGRLTIDVDTLPADMLLDIICALLDYEIIRQPGTDYVSVVPAS